MVSANALDSDNSYKVLKICIHEHGNKTREERNYDAMRGLETDNIGAQFVRHILDDFDMQGPSGHWHHCFVLTPAACTVGKLVRATGPLPLDAVKTITRNVLRALDFLHNDVQLVHTDIKASNVLLELKNQEGLEQFAQNLKDKPQKPKKDRKSPRRTYNSNQMPNYGREGWGAPILADLGEARWLPPDKAFAPAVVGAQAMRAPETLLGMDWGHEIDIWMVGCMFFDLLKGELLFDSPPGTEEWSETWHVAQIVALLGEPPVEVVQEGMLGKTYFSEGGQWLGLDGVAVPEMSFEEKLAGFDAGDTNVARDFVLGMLTWEPAKRKTAKQLLDHPFLQRSDTDSSRHEGKPEAEAKMENEAA